MRQRLRPVSVMVAALSLTAAACTSGGGGGGPGGGFTLTIGVVSSFTGDLQPFAEAGLKAVELAKGVFEEAANAKNLNVTIKVVSADDQGKPTDAVEAANKVVSDGATVIVGALGSAQTIPIAESVAIPKGVVQISPASTAAGITTLEDDGYVWRTVPTDSIQAKLIAKTMADLFGQDATVNVGARNDPYGDGLADGFETIWKAAGGTVGASERWDPEASSFDTPAQNLVAGSPDAWLIVDFPVTWAKIGPALLRTKKWDITKSFTTDGLKDVTLGETAGKELSEGFRGSAPGTGASPGADAFDKLWDDKAGKTKRQTFDAQAFDAAIAAFLAALKGGSSAGATIRDNLVSVAAPPGTTYTFENLGQAIQDILDGKDVDYEGASGQVNFDDKGDPFPTGAEYEIWEFTGGEIKVTSRVKADEI